MFVSSSSAGSGVPHVLHRVIEYVGKDGRLKKIASTSWVEEGSPAVDLVKNFEWTNDDQNTVAKYISKDGMSSDEAAAKWIEDNPDKVKAWLGLSLVTTSRHRVPGTECRSRARVLDTPEVAG